MDRGKQAPYADVAVLVTSADGVPKVQLRSLWSGCRFTERMTEDSMGAPVIGLREKTMARARRVVIAALNVDSSIFWSIQ